MMDDLKFKCANGRSASDNVRFSDDEHGKVYISIQDVDQFAEIILCRDDSEKLRDWLVEYLK